MRWRGIREEVERVGCDGDGGGWGRGGGGIDGIVDLEDIAGKGPWWKKAVNVAETNGKSDGKREMVTPVIRANLEKQGYKIIGSHSVVKICRWTKSQPRGRGGCYKHSFYGIESHRCMEATPSLACANKCVFCWRHHTNPVGKSWQWKMDDPIEIVNTAIGLHSKMIKQMKGVPGVTQERLMEGLSSWHCALSLVGEPIMYPEINMLVNELHRRRISTFLVTNAQFPEKVKILKPITQLYVSVDAATKDSLKAIDRPLFGTFGKDSFIGKPDFVEIKGVTYSGFSATSKLTMENVPWLSDVKAFSKALALKSEGSMRLHVNMHIHAVSSWQKQKSSRWLQSLSTVRIIWLLLTPSWAVYGAKEGGFDPDQSR
ncbi:hypothetical protein REPUB_Repub02eG0032800 [Reevesia pubescens]